MIVKNPGELVEAVLEYRHSKVPARGRAEVFIEIPGLWPLSYAGDIPLLETDQAVHDFFPMKIPLSFKVTDGYYDFKIEVRSELFPTVKRTFVNALVIMIPTRRRGNFTLYLEGISIDYFDVWSPAWFNPDTGEWDYNPGGMYKPINQPQEVVGAVLDELLIRVYVEEAGEISLYTGRASNESGGYGPFSGLEPGGKYRLNVDDNILTFL